MLAKEGFSPDFVGGTNDVNYKDLRCAIVIGKSLIKLCIHIRTTLYNIRFHTKKNYLHTSI